MIHVNNKGHGRGIKAMTEVEYSSERERDAGAGHGYLAVGPLGYRSRAIGLYGPCGFWAIWISGYIVYFTTFWEP